MSLLLRQLSASVSAGLEVESSLVLEPSPVASHAANLLTVVVWWRVREGGCSGVNSVALDAVEEARVFLFTCQTLSETLSDLHRCRLLYLPQ